MAADLLTFKPSDLTRMLEYLTAKKRPPFVWGPPGIGKSQIVHQFAASNDYRLIDLRAVLLDPVDLRGLPMVVDQITRWATPVFLPQGLEKVIVFFDELNRAPALTQAGCLQLTLDRRLGEYEVPENVVFVAAGNRESDGRSIAKMDPALSMRFVHLNAEPDLDEWLAWANTHDIHPMVTGFLRYRPALLSDFRRDDRTSPSPRGWEFVSDEVAGSPPKNLLHGMVEGTVGAGAAVEFLSFVDLYANLPSIDAILTNPTGADVPTHIGTLYALASALAHRARANNFDRVLAYLNRIPQEFAVYSVRDATTRDPDLTMTPAFNRWALVHADLI